MWDVQKLFKPLYYLGCKASLSNTIREAIDYIDPSMGRVCDLFSGSGAVGFALSGSRDVTAIDMQEYARVICAAQLNPPPGGVQGFKDIPDKLVDSTQFRTLVYCYEPLLELEIEAARHAAAGKADLLADLIEAHPIIFARGDSRSHLARARSAVRDRLIQSGMWKHADSTVSRYYGGVYFSFFQAIYLDSALAFAHRQEKTRRDLFLATILSTASSVVNTVGKQFAQPIRPRDKSGRIKSALIASALRDRAIDVQSEHRNWLRKYSELPITHRPHEAVRGDYLESLARWGNELSVVYADPPYTRDHYSRFYHVLETMCLRDEPEITKITKGGRTEPSRGVYRTGRHQSPFCVRSTAPSAFESLFQLVRQFDLPLVLSYSPSEEGDGTHPRAVTGSEIVKIAQKFYQHVDVQYLSGTSHNRHNRGELGLAERAHAEMLLLCRL